MTWPTASGCGTGVVRERNIGALKPQIRSLAAALTAAAPHSDVLIVGAGSAGSVVAERLSADPSCAVTVLEAGPGLADPALLAQTANGLQLPIGAGSPLVQRYQTQLTDRPARQLTIVRGATVGGSGAVNGGYFCRGLPRDFDGIGGTRVGVVRRPRSLPGYRDRPGFRRSRPR